MTSLLLLSVMLVAAITSFRSALDDTLGHDHHFNPDITSQIK